MENALQDTLDKMNPTVLRNALSMGIKKRSFNSSDDANKKMKAIDSDSGSSSEIDEKDFVNLYKGWTVPCRNYIITTISINNLTPAKFFKEYIANRRPVVITGIPDDLKILSKWTNEYLLQRAEEEKVQVEKRGSKSDSYGKGNEEPMSFGDFVKLVEAGDAFHYLTSQSVLSNEDGRPEILSNIMKKLMAKKESCAADKNVRKDLLFDPPLTPNLVKNLIPSNINLWMGNNQEGTSSGLHHDYHDNLYIVLRGTKRFRLYSPEDTENMYVRGELAKVHENGRINYKGELTTAYGADLKSDAAASAAKAKDEAEKMLIEAEEAVKEGKPGAQEQLEKAEEMLEMAMEQLLDAEMDGTEDGSDDEGFADEEEDLTNSTNMETELVQNNDTADEDTGDDHLGQDTCRDKTVKNPDNFSKMDPKILEIQEKLKEEFPLALNAKEAFCEVHENEILYLPASWFHEVTSFGSKQGHLALNYWFHPPDALDNFENPYSSSFWPNDFRARFDL